MPSRSDSDHIKRTQTGQQPDAARNHEVGATQDDKAAASACDDNAALLDALASALDDQDADDAEESAAAAAAEPGAERANAHDAQSAQGADSAAAATVDAGGGAEAAAGATAEAGAVTLDELKGEVGSKHDPWFEAEAGLYAATQLYHPGQDPCPILHENAGDKMPAPELEHVSGAKFDPSYLLPELKELEGVSPQLTARLRQEMLSGSSQLFNQLMLYHNLEQLGAQSIPDLNAAELRKLMAESLKSISWAELDQYCKLFWGLPPKLEDELKVKLQRAHAVLEHNLMQHLYQVGRAHNFSPFPEPNPNAYQDWYQRVEQTFYRRPAYMEEHRTVGMLLTRIGVLMGAPSAVWLFSQFSDFDMAVGIEHMRNLVFETYAQYEEDIRQYLKAHPLPDSKELDEVIFYAYLLADKTHLESDFEQYLALVQLSNQLTLFKMLSGGFCHEDNFEFDLVNYVNRMVGKNGLSGDYEPRDESDLASSALNSGTIFKTQYRNVAEFKRLLPHVYGLHFCYLDSVLQLGLNGMGHYAIPCAQLRMHIYNLGRISNTIFIKRADQRANLSALDLNLCFISPLLGYIFGQDALAIGRHAVEEFNWRVKNKDSAGVFYYQLLASDAKSPGYLASLPEYSVAQKLFKDSLSDALSKGEFTPQMEKWALHLFVKQRILEFLTPVGVPVTGAAGMRIEALSNDNLRAVMELICSYVIFSHNLIFKHFMAGAYGADRYMEQHPVTPQEPQKRHRKTSYLSKSERDYLAYQKQQAAKEAEAERLKQREPVFLDHFLACNARIGSSVALYDEHGLLVVSEKLQQRVSLGGARDDGGRFDTVSADTFGGKGKKGGTRHFNPESYVPGMQMSNSPELILASQLLSQDARSPYLEAGRAAGQILGRYHTPAWVIDRYSTFNLPQVSSYGELIGDTGTVALIPGTPAWSSYLMGRAWYTGELIGSKQVRLGYALLCYADLAGCYEASSYVATMCQPLFLSNANDEGRLFLYQHLRALASFHLGRIACDYGHYRVRLFRSYDRYIERHDFYTALHQLVDQDPDLRTHLLALNPTLFSHNGSSGHVNSHGGHSSAVVQAALRLKGWDVAAWLPEPSAVLAANQPYSVRAALGPDGLTHWEAQRKFKDEFDPHQESDFGRAFLQRSRLALALDRAYSLPEQRCAPYIPIDILSTKGGLPLCEVNAWGVVLANTILILCDYLTRTSFMATRYQVLIESMMSELAELMRREYCPDGCCAVFKYLTTPIIQRKNFELISPNYWLTVLFGQLTGSGAQDCSPLHFFPEDDPSRNTELAVMFLQLGMMLPEYREQGYALIADLIENTAGDLVPVLMPYLDEYVRGAAVQQEGPALHYLTQAARMKGDETLADLLAMFATRAEDCRSFKAVSQYLVRHQRSAERKNFAQRLFFMHQPYGLYEQYLALRDDPEEVALAHSSLFYAAALQVPEAKVELAALEAAGKFKPLPFIIYLRYLQQMAETNVQARAVLMMLSVNGDILPPDFMSLYRLADDAQITFGNSALKAELLKRGVMGPNNMGGTFSQRSSWIGLFGPELNTLEHNNKVINGNFAHWQGSVEMVDLETYGFLNFGLSDHKVQDVVRKLFVALSQGKSALERLLTYNWLRSDLFPEFLQDKAAAVSERVNVVESVRDLPAIVCMQRLFSNVMDMRFNDFAGTFTTALCPRVYVSEPSMHGVGVISYNLLNDGVLRPSYSQFLYGALYSLREVNEPNFALFKGFCRLMGNLGKDMAQRYALLNYAHLSGAPYGEAFDNAITRPHEDALQAAAPFLSGSLVHGSAITRLMGQLMHRRLTGEVKDIALLSSNGDMVASPETEQTAQTTHNPTGEQDEAQVVYHGTKSKSSSVTTQDLVHNVLGYQRGAQQAETTADFADLTDDAHDLVHKLGITDRSSSLARALGVRWRRNATSPDFSTLKESGAKQWCWDQILPNGMSPAPLSYYLDQELPEELEIYLEVLVSSSYFLYGHCSSLYQLLLYCRNGWQLGRKAQGPKRSYASLLARDMMRGMPDSCSNFLYYCQSHLFKYDFGGNFSENEQIKLARKFMQDVLQLDVGSVNYQDFAQKMAREGFTEFNLLLQEQRNGMVPGKLRFLPDGVERSSSSSGYLCYYHGRNEEMGLDEYEASAARKHLVKVRQQLDRLTKLSCAQRRAFFEPSDDALICNFAATHQDLPPKKHKEAYQQLLETLRLRATIERLLTPDDFERLLTQSDFLSTTFSDERNPISQDAVISMLGFTCSILPYAALRSLDEQDQVLVLQRSGFTGTDLTADYLAVAQGHELWGFNYDQRERRWQRGPAELNFIAQRAPSNFHERFNSFHTFGTTYTNSSYQVTWLQFQVATARHNLTGSAPAERAPVMPDHVITEPESLAQGLQQSLQQSLPSELLPPDERPPEAPSDEQAQEELALLQAVEAGRAYHGPLFDDEAYYGYDALRERLTKISLTYDIDLFGLNGAASPEAARTAAQGTLDTQVPQRVRTRRGFEATLSARREVAQLSARRGKQAKTEGVQVMDEGAGELSGTLKANTDPSRTDVALTDVALTDVDLVGGEHSTELFSRLQNFVSDKLGIPDSMGGLSNSKPQSLNVEAKDAYGVYERYASAAEDSTGGTNFDEELYGPGTYLRYLNKEYGQRKLDFTSELQPCCPSMFYEEDSPLMTLIYLIVMRGMIEIELKERYQFEQNFLTIFARMGYYYGACDVVDSAFVTTPFVAYKVRFERKAMAAHDDAAYGQAGEYMLGMLFKDVNGTLVSLNSEEVSAVSTRLARYLGLPDDTPPSVLRPIIVTCGDYLYAFQSSGYWRSLMGVNSAEARPSDVLYLLDDSLLHYTFRDLLKSPDLLACAPNLQDSLTGEGPIAWEQLCALMGFDLTRYQQLVRLSNSLGRVLTYEETQQLKIGALDPNTLNIPKTKPQTNNRGLNHASELTQRALKSFKDYTPLREGGALFWLNFSRPEFLLRHRDPEIDPRLEPYLKVWYDRSHFESLSTDQRMALKSVSSEITQMQQLWWHWAQDRYALAQHYFPQRLKSKLQRQWVGPNGQQPGASGSQPGASGQQPHSARLGTTSLGQLISSDEAAQLLCYPPSYLYTLACGYTLSYGRSYDPSEVNRLLPQLHAAYEYQGHMVCDAFALTEPLKYFIDSATIDEVVGADDSLELEPCYSGNLELLVRALWERNEYRHQLVSKFQVLIDLHYTELYSRELRYNFDHNWSSNAYLDDLALIRSTHRPKMWYRLRELGVPLEILGRDYSFFLPSAVNQALGVSTALNLGPEVAALRARVGLPSTPARLVQPLEDFTQTPLTIPRSQEQEQALAYLTHPEWLSGSEHERKEQLLAAVQTESAYLQQRLQLLQSKAQDLSAQLDPEHSYAEVSAAASGVGLDAGFNLSAALGPVLAFMQGKAPHSAYGMDDQPSRTEPQQRVLQSAQLQALNAALLTCEPQYENSAFHQQVEEESHNIDMRSRRYGFLRGYNEKGMLAAPFKPQEPQFDPTVFEELPDAVSLRHGRPQLDEVALTFADMQNIKNTPEQPQEEAPTFLNPALNQPLTAPARKPTILSPLEPQPAPAPLTEQPPAPQPAPDLTSAPTEQDQPQPSAQTQPQPPAPTTPMSAQEKSGPRTPRTPDTTSKAARLVQMSMGKPLSAEEQAAQEMEALSEDINFDFDADAFDAVDQEQIANFARYLISEGVDLWDVNAVADVLIKLRLHSLMEEGYTKAELTHMLENGEISFDQEIALSDLLSTNAQLLTDTLLNGEQPSSEQPNAPSAAPQAQHPAHKRPEGAAHKRHGKKKKRPY